MAEMKISTSTGCVVRIGEYKKDKQSDEDNL